MPLARLPLALLLAGAAASLAAAQSFPPPAPDDLTGNINSSMIIAIIVLIVAFFFLGFFSLYIRRCAGDRAGVVGTLPARPVAAFLAGSFALRSSRRPPPRGLDRAVIDSFPVMAFADVKAHRAGDGANGALECAICLTEFAEDDELRLLPKCRHAFHPDCIDVWLASHVTCPVCRANLEPVDDDVKIEVAPPSPHAEAERPLHSFAAAVAVAVDAEEDERQNDEREIKKEALELERIGSVMRSKSARQPAKPFRRSHTTGHSPTETSADVRGVERFTLRLPDHVLMEIIAAGELRRTASVVASSRGSELESASRTWSLRWPMFASTRRVEGEASTTATFAGGGVSDGGAVECDGGACPLRARV